MNTEEFSKELEKNKKILEICSKKLAMLPEGALITQKDKANVKYFVKTNKRQYLGKNQQELVKALEEKYYYQHLQKTAEANIKALESIIITLEQVQDTDSVFLNIPKEKTNYIKPVEIKHETFEFRKEYRTQSEKTTYKINDSLKTKAGEYVRSKSELIIADKLFDFGVSYRYEPNVELENYMRVNPDFMVMNKRTGKVYYWEHFGMMDKPEYCWDTQIKLENYVKNNCMPGLKLIFTIETTKRPLSTETVELVIKKYLL